jgi:Flp pilus assembly pilin Flp
MRKWLAAIVCDETGATVIEYALTASLIAMSLVSAFLALGGTVNGYYETVAEDYLSANQ